MFEAGKELICLNNLNPRFFSNFSIKLIFNVKKLPPIIYVPIVSFLNAKKKKFKQKGLTMTNNTTPDYLKKRVLILGCGSILFGDDGFGPATIEYMKQNCAVPDDVYLMDVGTGAGKVLLTLDLSEEKPRKIIIFDAVDLKKKSGEVFQISIEELPKNKVGDFSPHIFPTTNFLKKLRDTGNIEVFILACQVENVPELVNPGLSKSVKKAIPKAARMALELARNSKS
jgi:coenzyme F420 hydrogenase subunit delta